MSQMYFVQSKTETGDVFNYFVAANSAQEALDMWAVHVERECGFPLQKWFEPAQFIWVYRVPEATVMGLLYWSSVKTEIKISIGEYLRSAVPA